MISSMFEQLLFDDWHSWMCLMFVTMMWQDEYHFHRMCFDPSSSREIQCSSEHASIHAMGSPSVGKERSPWWPTTIHRFSPRKRWFSSPSEYSLADRHRVYWWCVDWCYCVIYVVEADDDDDDDADQWLTMILWIRVTGWNREEIWLDQNRVRVWVQWSVAFERIHRVSRSWLLLTNSGCEDVDDGRKKSCSHPWIVTRKAKQSSDGNQRLEEYSTESLSW